MAKKLVNVVYKVDDSDLRKLRTTLGKSEQDTKDLSNQLKNTGNAAKKAGKDGGDSFLNFGNIIKTISVIAITQQIIELGKKVITTRGEFQKFEAVLTNTLGTKSAALVALGRINEFAKTTPFSVAELTDSFIKLANRGVEPTINEMRAIADLSATLGKDFNQVVEAILDINNPERWKEIGVKAETAGDKVKLSFRDSTIEVDRTVRGVTDAVTALGQLNGVAGSTEAISKTLGGQVSNLGDVFLQLFNTIGYANEGVLSELIQGLSEVIELTDKLLKSSGQRFEELQSKTLAAETESFKSWVTVTGEIEKAAQIFEQKREARLISIAKKQRELMDQTDLDPVAENRRQEELEHLRFLYDIYDQDLPKAIDETIAAINKKKAAENAAASAAAQKKLAEESKKIGKEVNDYLAYLSDQELFNTEATLKAKAEQRKNEAENEKENAERSAEHQEYYRKLRERKEKEAADERVKIAEDEAARKRRIEEDLYYASFTLARALVDFAFSSRESEIDHIRDYYDEQERLAGDNERAKMEIDIKRERAVQKAREREKEEEKKQARNRIIAGTAVNVVEAFPNPVLMALAAALGLVQLASVQKLATGGWVKGPGTTTSDSVPILASNKEFVVNADAAGKSRNLLEAINSKQLTDQALRGGSRSGGSFSDNRMVAKLSAIEQQLKDSRQDDLVERHGRLMRATRRSRDHVMLLRAKVMGDFI